MLQIARVPNHLHKGFTSVPVLRTDPWGAWQEGRTTVEVTLREGTNCLPLSNQAQQ